MTFWKGENKQKDAMIGSFKNIVIFFNSVTMVGARNNIIREGQLSVEIDLNASVKVPTYSQMNN